MNVRDMDLNLIRVLGVLLNQHSVTLAAETLDLTQSTVSHALARLRKLFSDPLLVRSGNSMQLTPKALQLQPIANEILALVENRLLREAGFDPAVSRRRFSISTTDTGEVIMAPAMVRYLQRHAPGVSLRFLSLSTQELHAALVSGEVDIAVGAFPDLPASVIYQQRLRYQADFVCVLRHDHPDIRQSLSVTQYLAARHVAVHVPGVTHAWSDPELTARGLARTVALTVPHIASALQIVAETDLLLTLPAGLEEYWPSGLPLRALPSPIPMDGSQVNQYWHTHLNRDAANIWLRRMIYELFVEQGIRTFKGLSPMTMAESG